MSAEKLAERIADDLMENSWGEKAQRLVLELPGGLGGGGLCRESVIKCAEKHLKENPFWKPE